MKKFLAITLTLCMLLTSVVIVSAEEAQYGVTQTIMVDNCDENSFGEVSTDEKTEGAASNKVAYAAGQSIAPGAIMWRKALETPIDVSATNRFAFDLYVSKASEFTGFDFCLFRYFVLNSRSSFCHYTASFFYVNI